MRMPRMNPRTLSSTGFAVFWVMGAFAKAGNGRFGDVPEAKN
jgi:hypothetical protein